MGRISQWAVRHPWFGLASWLLLVAVIVALFTQLKGDYNDNFNLPESESTTAQNLLKDLSGGAGTGSGLDGQVVWKSGSGKVTETVNAAVVTTLLTEISKAPGVTCVVTPLGAPLGSACPQQPPSQGQGGRVRRSSHRPSPARRAPWPTSARRV